MDISSISRNSFTKPLLLSPALSHSSLPQRRRPNNNIVSCYTKTANFYEVLSLRAENAGEDEIKKAYRAKALQYHPDVCHPSMRDESARLFVQLHKAYKTLSDPVSRDRYDRQLRLLSDRVERRSYDEVGVWRERWEAQLWELKKGSDSRLARKEGSWGSRMRAQRN